MILKLIQRLVVGERIANMTWAEATAKSQTGQLTIHEMERVIRIARLAKEVQA